MKRLLLIILFFSLHLGAALAGDEKAQSEILTRLFDYQQTLNPEMKGKKVQVYSKTYYEIYRRNFLLWAIPSMYTIARGERKFLSETYGIVKFNSTTDVDLYDQVYYTTIPHDQRTMSILEDFTTPTLYHTTLFGKYLLSPFCRENRYYYKYKVSIRNKRVARIDFKPRAGNNVQLVSGTVLVDRKTGRLLNAVFNGEYDLIKFQTTLEQNHQAEADQSTPQLCKTDVTFKFFGNHIISSTTTVFNCPTQLPDTVDVTGDRKMMESLRPIELTAREKSVYAQYDKERNSSEDTVRQDTTFFKQSFETIKDVGYDVGTYLLKSHGTSSQKFNFRLSPILKPQYISYSQSRGLSYKLNLAADYYINEKQGLSFNPTMGYNFKIHQLYAYVPLRYTYNKKKDNFLQLSWNFGNRIGNSSVLDELKDERGEIKDLNNINLEEFNDAELRLTNYTQVNNWLRLELGAVYHRRTAVKKEDMIKFNKPTVYHSLAPSVGLHMRPWKNGPSLNLNYEYSFKNKFSDQVYERWEFSATKIHEMASTKRFNMQLGAGLYTYKRTGYFLHFSHFCVNNLPGGFDDDWSGDFQLLDSRLYNISRYYINANLSFDTPLMLTSFIPYVGKHIERERIYWSGLLIEHTRPYNEVGYAFTTKLFSVGIFANMFNLTLEQFGTKFTFELFRRW